MSLRQLTISSAAMGSVGVLRMMAQLLIIPALARFLSPADYGIVAIAMPFVLFGMMFADAGMSASLIRTTSKNIHEWSTSFWLIIMLGLGLSLALIGLGYIVSIFLAEPKLFPIISFLSLIVILQSVATVPGAALQQEHRFTTIAGIEIFAMALSLTGTYLAATHGWGAWSLVAQQIIQYTIKLILTLILSPFRPHFIFKIDQIVDHLTFGRDMIGNNIVWFARQCLTNTLTGKFLGTSAVGIYTMASLFSDLPNRLVSGPMQVVVYPRMARLKDNPVAIRDLFLFLSRIMATLVIPAMGMLAVAHQPVFTIFLSEKWQHSGFIFMLLAPAGTVQAVTALRGTIAMAMGRTDIMLRQAWEGAVLAIIALVCFVHFGIEAVAVAANIVTFLYTPRALLQIFKLIDLPVKNFITVISAPVMSTIAGIALYLLITGIFAVTNWEAFGIAFMIGTLSLVTAFFAQFNSIRRETGIVKKSLDGDYASATTPVMDI